MAHTRTWDESQPVGGTIANTLDTIIQNFKTDLRERMRLEHDFNGSQSPGTTYDGVLLEGAGRANTKVIGSIPANRGSVQINGAAGNEDGRLFIGTDTGEFMYSDGTNWLTAIKKITGILSVTGLMSGLSKQILSYSRVAVVGAPAAYPAYNSGYLQGSAGLDFSGRSGASSILFLALSTFTLTSGSASNGQSRLVFDNVGTQIGLEAFQTLTTGTGLGQNTIIGFKNDVTAAAHSFDLQIKYNSVNNVNFTQAQVFAIDLGITAP